MVVFLSELWRLAQYLLRPEQTNGANAGSASEAQDCAPCGQAPALTGLAKTLLWAGLAVLAGFGLAQLK